MGQNYELLVPFCFWCSLYPQWLLVLGSPCPMNCSCNTEKTKEELEKDNNEDLDETLLEWLCSLMEMFPKRVQSMVRATLISPSLWLKKCISFPGQPCGLGPLHLWSWFFLLSMRLRSRNARVMTFTSWKRSTLLTLHLSCFGGGSLKLSCVRTADDNNNNFKL